MMTLLTHAEALIIFGIMFIFSAAGLCFLSKQNSTQLEKLAGTTEKIIDNQARFKDEVIGNQVRLNSKVDILQHDSGINTQLLKDLNSSRYDFDKRLNLVEKYIEERRVS